MQTTATNGRITRGTVAPKVEGHFSRDRSNRPGWRLPKADKVLYVSATAAPWGLAILLLAVSMPHLASGFQSITRCGPMIPL